MNDLELVDTLCRRVAEIPGDVDTVVRRHVRAVAPLADEAHQSRLVAAAVARLAGLDGLDALMADRDVDEILVNAGGEVWVERAGELHAAQPLPPSSIPVVLERVLAPLGRRLDRTNPIVDARLPDGSRVCAVIGPVAVDGAAVSIRRFRQRPLPLSAFTSAAVVELLTEVLRARCNVVVSGATSSGKTSLLAALLSLTEPARAHHRLGGHGRAAAQPTPTSCGSRPDRQRPTASARSLSTSSCARRCVCDPTASSSARSEATR